MRNLRRNNSGFTLIELIVVMIIIGILVLLATPRFLNYVKDARVTALQVDSKVLMDGALLANIDQSRDGQADKDNYPTTGGVVTIADADVKRVLVGTVKEIGDKNFTEADISELELKKLDADIMKNHIRNTKYPMDDFLIATDGAAEGEVFYVNRVMENGRGDKFVHMIMGEEATK